MLWEQTVAHKLEIQGANKPDDTMRWYFVDGRRHTVQLRPKSKQDNRGR